MAQSFPDPPARLHFIGIKGQAMTALAQIFQDQGYVITGSDTAEVFPTDAVLRRLNIPVVEQFSGENIGPDIQGVIYSTAYLSSHPERLRAEELGLPTLSYPEAVSILFEIYHRSIAIAGSHGKTTTTSLTGHMLEQAGADPTVIVGSVDKVWNANARVGTSEWFVLEADEYQNKFHYYSPRYLLVTNVDYDHPDFFPDRQSYENVFLDFVSKVPNDGLVVLCADDAFCLSLQSAAKANVVTYGKSADARWQLRDITIEPRRTTFAIVHEGKEIPLSIPFAGEHYALNATGAFALLSELGLPHEPLVQAIKQFHGTSRRMEYKGEYHGAIVIDDFAHHPAEITATLQAVHAEYPSKKIVAVFHPHTFSRTAALFDEHVEALRMADQVYLLPIYGSAREKQGTVKSEALIKRINERGGHAELAASLDEVVNTLKATLGSHDVIITMGAGDVWKAAEALLV